ncbi:membrane dipeptidase [Pseudenhygromyxa sp. WMMC2535]|uniref:membrane dipeptidase n=1 Tax=Pseudenhygromyxa sp. WMMC2535 TaxID=2712867 RepID=UPI00155490D2|nr:membrane dipeptidase [Pseudenhygromyxa sp. WMMC2535]NVB37687.1 membrane dipeptidase [Pseudenhygromyxa sp. WMMC2535]
MVLSPPRFAALPFAAALTCLACQTPPADEGSDDEVDETATATETATDTDTGEPEPDPLTGVADLHLHMFAEEAFGGGWFHGSASGAAEVALALCDGGASGDHAQLQEDLSFLFEGCDPDLLSETAAQVPYLQAILTLGGHGIAELIAEVPGSSGDTGTHLDRTGGYPDYEGWPRWDVIAHQQSWEGWLEQAYNEGLRVSVISAVSFDWLCEAVPEENRTRPQCDEMADVIVQLEQANALAANNDWAEIALTAEDARRIVSEDKLAIVLSIEASHIFGDDDWREALDEVYGLGVRTLQLVHQLDNRFGGAAPHNEIFQIAGFAENCRVDSDCGLTTQDLTLGFDVDADCRNTLGLTSEGRELVEEMIARGMLIDMAHMSEQLVGDVYEIAVDNDYYPLYLSHAHFREIMLPAKAKQEKTTPSWVVQTVRETGGMIGLRTAHEEVNDYTPSAIDNSCHGSSRSFAQAYDYGRLGLGVSIGTGSDLNGFIQQTRPRFGDQACSASFTEEAQCQARDERAEGLQLGTEFDEIGLGRMDMLGDLLDDLELLGTDVEPLRRSADDFVRMWERAEGERSGMIPDLPEMNLEGVVINPSHYERRQALPQECDTPYCPGALLAGEDCMFDAQCESGSCAGAGECGEPAGVCE